MVLVLGIFKREVTCECSPSPDICNPPVLLTLVHSGSIPNEQEKLYHIRAIITVVSQAVNAHAIFTTVQHATVDRTGLIADWLENQPDPCRSFEERV
jgi:hypothetical protein